MPYKEVPVLDETVASGYGSGDSDRFCFIYIAFRQQLLELAIYRLIAVEYILEPLAVILLLRIRREVESPVVCWIVPVPKDYRFIYWSDIAWR